MKAVFADTFYFCALLNRADAAHGAVTDFARRNTRPVVTTVLVFAELANAFSETGLRARTGESIRVLQSSSRGEVVPLGRALWAASLRLYQKREDKTWSLTDGCLFVVMRNQSLTVALTGDHDFVQAGFDAVFA